MRGRLGAAGGWVWVPRLLRGPLSLPENAAEL
jgi:hypothetical protein